MKLEVLKKETDFIEFKLIGERHSFPNLLKTKLLKDSNVEFVSYKLMHPMDPDAVFVLRTKGKPAKTVLLNAAKEIEEDLDDFAKKISKAMK